MNKKILILGIIITFGVAIYSGLIFSITDYQTSQDTYVYEEKPTTNFGLAEQLRVVSGTTSEAKTLLLFQVRFPDNITLNNADLTLYADNINLGSGAKICASQVTSHWGYSWITWSNQPSYVSPHSSNCLTSTSNLVIFNVTSIVQNWLNGDSNHGIAIVGTGIVHATFHSLDSTLITSTPPTLTIDYTTEEEEKTVKLDPANKDDTIKTKDSKGKDATDDFEEGLHIPLWVIILILIGIVIMIIGLIKRR